MDAVSTSANDISSEFVTTSDVISSSPLGEELCRSPQHLQDEKILSNEESESDDDADVVTSNVACSIGVTFSECKVSIEKLTLPASGVTDICVSSPETSEISEGHDLTKHVDIHLSDESSDKLADDLNSNESSSTEVTESPTECTGDVDNDTLIVSAPSLDLFDNDNEESLPKDDGKDIVSKDSGVPGLTHSVDEDGQDPSIECLNTKTNSKTDGSEEHTSTSQSNDQECTNVDKSKELESEFGDMDRPSSKSDDRVCVNHFDKNKELECEASDLDSSSSTQAAVDGACNVGGNKCVAVVPDLNKTLSKALATNTVEKNQNNDEHDLQEVNVESESNIVNAEDKNHNSLNSKSNDIELVNLDNNDDDEDMETCQNNDAHDLQEVNSKTEPNIVNDEDENRDSLNSKSNNIELVDLDNDDEDMENDNPKLYAPLNSAQRSLEILDDEENKNGKNDKHVLSENSDSGKEPEIIENENQSVSEVTVYVNKDNSDADKSKGPSENETISDKSQLDSVQSQVGVENILPSECDVVLAKILPDLGKDVESLPEKPHANVPTRASNQNSNVEVVDLSDDEIGDVTEKEKDKCTLELQCEDDPVAENHVPHSTLTILDSGKEAVQSVNGIVQNSEVQFNENEKALQTGISLGPGAASSPLMPVLIDCSTYMLDGNLCMVPLVQLPGVSIPGPPAPIPIPTATNLGMPLDEDKEDPMLSEMTFEIEKMKLPDPPARHSNASSYKVLKTIVSNCKDLEIPLVRCDNFTDNDKHDRQDVLPDKKAVKRTKGSKQNLSNHTDIEEKSKSCKAGAIQNASNTPVFGQVSQFGELSFSSLCAKTNQTPVQSDFSTSTPKDQASTGETQVGSRKNKSRKRSQEVNPDNQKAKKAKTTHKVKELSEAETITSVLPTKPSPDSENHNSANVNDQPRLQKDTETTLRGLNLVNSLPTSKGAKEVKNSCTVDNASSNKPVGRDLTLSEDNCENADKSDGEVSFFTSEDSGSEPEDIEVVNKTKEAIDLVGEYLGAPGTGSQYLIPAVVTKPNEVNLWKCFLCEKAFQEHSKLKKHFAFHVKKVVFAVLKTQPKFDCIFCGKPLHSKEALKFHMKKKHQVSEGTKYSCLFCSGLFLTNDELKEHIKIQHWSQAEQSKTVPSPKMSTEEQKSEKKQDHPKVELLPKVRSRVMVKRKIDFEEPSPRKKQNVAPNDGKISEKRTLDSNRRSDKPVNTVNVKNGQTLNVLARQTRSLVKGPEDKSKANEDENAQASSSGTSKYSKRNANKYSCRQCHVDFRNLALLSKHKVAKHKSENALANRRTLKCPYCEVNKSFTANMYLNRHIKIFHPNAKNSKAKDDHVCKVCKRSFPFESHLDQHFRIHHAETTADVLPDKSLCNSRGFYKCPMCPKTYRKLYFLEFHMRLKHPGLVS